MNPLSSVTPLTYTAPTRSLSYAIQNEDAPALPADRADLSAPQAKKPTEAPAAPVTRPAPEPAAPPPTTLQMGASTPEGEEELRWILDAAKDTQLKDHPGLPDITRRFPQLPEEIRAHGTIPLLDALTEPDKARASARMDDFHDTLTWARKNRSDARALLAGGGTWQTLQAKAIEERDAVPPQSSLDRARAGAGFLKSYPIGHNHEIEGSRLVDQLEAGNDNPGLGTKTLGKGICYLRGREGTRVFYRMNGDKPQYLAICNKSNESSAIDMIYREFDFK